MDVEAKQAEREIKRDILAYLGSRADCMVWNNPTGTARALTGGYVINYGLRGSPDIIGVWSGRAIGVEVKTAIGRIGKDQAQFRIAWERRGGLYILARSVNDVQKALSDEQNSYRCTCCRG